jgi:hypothetical protein
MINILRTCSFILTAVIVFIGCRKVQDLPFYDKGNSVVLAASKTAVVATPADSSRSVINFTWTDPNYATESSNVKYLLQIDSAGRNFSRAVTREINGNRMDSLTGRELNAITLNYGFAPGSVHVLEARIISSYANNNERYTSNVVKINVTPFADPSRLTTTTTSVTGTLATASQTAATFSWSPSFPGYSGAITYSIEYDSAGKNFSNAKELASGSNMLNRTLTQSEVNTAAMNSGITAGNSGKVDFRIKAVTALGAIAYSNVISIDVNTYIPLLRFYLPGSYQAQTGNGNDWSPETAPELIRDMRPEALNSMYYTYIFLPAGAKFKVTQGRGWDINYGGSGGNLEQNGSDFEVTTAGVYRISIDLKTMKYDIREGRMGFVGGAVDGVGWNPGATFPAAQMGFAGTNLFVGIHEFSTGGWKMIDFNDWNDGSFTVTNARSYGSTGGSGSTMEVNGPNMPDITTAGRYRVIWDGRDPDNIKYEISPATEMRVVGDGITGVNVWSPGVSPQMTYEGNGIWKITLALEANKDIKFLAGNDWGAFDYEDAGPANGAGSRKIKWEGGDNFKTPATAGTYTITLNEYTQTVTIN